MDSLELLKDYILKISPDLELLGQRIYVIEIESSSLAETTKLSLIDNISSLTKLILKEAHLENRFFKFGL